jgi:GNAT superfamily N-acetyltransferase
VDPHHHRRGVGRSLIEAAVKRCAPRNERQYLQVNAAPNAIEFYRSMGFAKLEDARVFGTSTPMALPLCAQ